MELSTLETVLLAGLVIVLVFHFVIAIVVDRLSERVRRLELASLSNGIVLGPGETVQFGIGRPGIPPVTGRAVGLGPNPKGGDTPCS